jgi:3',5'-nucleoside bisphosphate phosphatase
MAVESNPQFCYTFSCFPQLSRLENFDLHNHSTRSDGLLTPTQLIELAARTGVDAIALTDHDTLEGLEEAALAARRLGVRFVPGVEISVSWGDTTLHIVGLQVDPASTVLREGLDSIRAGRVGRARRIGEALARLGFANAFESALEIAADERVISRTHFARHLAESGAVKDTQAAFDKYLAKGKPAYVPHQWATLEDAVKWIRAAGGIAVVAHPGRYGLKPMFRDEMLAQFREYGGTAIEVVTGSHRPEEYATWQRVALEHGFLASRGADYHGPGESPCEPGRLPPLHPSLTPVWSGWAH